MATQTAARRPEHKARHDPDREYHQLERVISHLDLHDDKKEWMKDRWLEQVRWFDAKAVAASKRHYALRILAIVGGVLIPPLVAVQSGNEPPSWARGAAIVLSVLVAGSVGLDELFHWGDRWRHYRRTAELLKIEGWLFIEGGGRYKGQQRRHDFHERFFSLFASKVEDLVRHDVDVYLSRIVQDHQEDRERDRHEVEDYLGPDAGDARAPDDPEPASDAQNDPSAD
jgi:Protein of unknown function (DUF4231)